MAISQGNSSGKLRIGVLGVGRMGRRHASNVAYSAPRAELVAVADPNHEALAWAKANLPSTVQCYSDSADVIQSTNVDAVLISTETSEHARLALEAASAGKHVLLEKPISVDVDLSRPVVEAARKHPELKIMIGLSRRYDASYREAKKRIDNGSLGKPYLIKSCTNDQYDSTGFFIAYSKASGGIFIDCGIHDIDISRWLLDVENPANLKYPKKQVTSVWATGLNAQHPELTQYGDCDNAICVVEYENGAKCNFHLSRTAIHGHDCFCEVFGTDSKLVINGNPNMNRVEIRDIHGVRMESTPTYYDRFRDAFISEVQTFCDVVLDDKPVPTPPQSALEAAKIAMALTHSFRTGKTVYFDNEGEAIIN
ncbi:transposase subfamily [Cryptococcus neoformans C23]|uniref:Transposase subfamily n=1 Tax=Cryptococcus neoformans (strain H99 / ATCC 208821 / CBS 10515 / FGSC 9487) TaxID=235443 RepID=J9VPP5_CRYN9|nr:transposase subfamily [Cryptococcus neoformans var. grubii H99]XP_012048856.1 transposase subfamily, variant [Cryptococcus neoformans var. grubii H99]AUB24263.1 transposase subfamily [Cryptococcus neoformans var. grubii]OWZ32938.1 transposase subfamily [Cryptococcus neoformans var. grubii AD2-60a]OWZ45049.1 transposase subfamily [Cryptococcus neoformans var. grubii C23]OWZ54934.1 transposase subfamily [Cryptococcus neoformans var. grubii 125.91]OXC85311.1 transposase subfamily [Cryptococcu|eukprot:XP_012048855.1 transposase subfamily [Cryptococcus neoformans var. grubii H99]